MQTSWPPEELEAVLQCPYCGEAARTLAFESVEDWAFGCAPGRWQYWECAHCKALYLDLRPTEVSIGRAYKSYYTHASGTNETRCVSTLKQRIRNELWSQTWSVSISPRLSLPRWLSWTVAWLGTKVAEPFGLRELAQRRKGLLIDVGCGNGDKLRLAEQLGWTAVGIEMDASAVRAVRQKGLSVEHGGYELLDRYRSQADCVVCSHVLEHVHQPVHLLQMLIAAVKPSGVILLSAPNAASFLRNHYGKHWRGLEAPRHLAIPSAQWLIEWLRTQGVRCLQVPSHGMETAIESERIRRKGQCTEPGDVLAARTLLRQFGKSDWVEQDIVQLVCERTDTR